MQLVCLLQDTIWNKYLDMPLTEEEYAMVFEIDDALLYHEFVALMDTRLGETKPGLRSKPVFEFLGFKETEKEFLRLFRELSGEETQ